LLVVTATLHQMCSHENLGLDDMEEWERLLEELRAELIMREQELDLLHQIDLRMLDEELSHRELLPYIVERTQRLLRANHISILFRRSLFLEAAYSNLRSVVGQRVSIAESLTGLCLETGAPLRISDLAENPHWQRYTPLRGYRGAPMRSLLATPIRIRGSVIGVLNAESRTAHAFNPGHERVAEAIAAHIAIALQRTQGLGSTVLFADLERQMFAGGDPQGALQAALERVMAELRRLEHIKHNGAYIMFLHGEDDLEIVNSTNPSNNGLVLPTGASTAGRAVRARKTVIVRDVGEDPDYQPLFGEGIRSEIAVPITYGKDNIAIGALNVDSEGIDAFNDFYQLILEGFVEKVKPLLAFAKLQADVAEALELRTADDLLVAIGDRTSHMIHRLNNTVGAMRVQILELQDERESGTLDDNFLDDSLKSLLESAERTLEFLDEVNLDEDGTTDVNECVRSVARALEGRKDVNVQLELGEEVPALHLYSFDIVIQNLIQNAVDAMPNGGTLSVSTSAIFYPGRPTGYFRLIVKDTGIGVPSEIQRQIFELNFTTKDTRGHGLGLWWVRNFVRRARGDISLRSAVGSGTEFTVKIPIDLTGHATPPNTAGREDRGER
jgi:signal transduction histidine kinase